MNIICIDFTIGERVKIFLSKGKSISQGIMAVIKVQITFEEWLEMW